MVSRIVILIPCLVLTFSSAIPKSDDGKKRVLDTPLSSESHYENEIHNSDYDHEAFLGESDAKSFDQLSPDESKDRLGIIFDKIDKDKNGFVTEEELRDWIKYTQRRYIAEDVDRQWKAHNTEGGDKITWDEYRKATYGYMADNEVEEDQDENGYSYKDMLRRDKRRFEIADVDKDGSLTKEEFLSFLHPEDAVHMRDVVVQETIEDIDKDKDGKISLEEYIGDMYKGAQGDQEPDWVKVEREQFTSYRDKDKDGKMDPEEVKNWIIPSDYDNAEAEAKHLIHESDSDGNKMLSKDEVIEKYDLFVGSQATDFGEALVRHDEF